MGTIIKGKKYSISENDKVFTVLLNKKNFDTATKKFILSFKNGLNYYQPSVSYSKNIVKDAYSAETRFLGELVNGIAINKRCNGAVAKIGTLTERKDGRYCIKAELPKPKLTDLLMFENIVPKEKPSNVTDNIVLSKVNDVIADPNSASAKNLVGRNVEISRTFNFSDAKRIKLTNIDADSTLPFYGITLDEGKQVSGVFIREYKIIREALDLDDKAVRDFLRGKWIVNKANGQETMITSFRKVDGHYQCNGIDARTLMTSWEFDNGGLIGVEK